MENQNTIRKATRELVGRQLDAYARLVSCLSTNGALDKSDAEMVANAYIRHKLVKLDGVDGQFYLKHGSFMDADCIQTVLGNLAAGVK